MHSRILVPVDLEHSEKLGKALELAARTAREHGAQVVYADVVDAVPTMSLQREDDRVADRLHRFAQEQASIHNIEAVDRVVLRSDLKLNVGSDIIKAATDEKCDLIVMASHVPGLKEHFLSSNAGYVACHAPMSVYVVR